MLGGVGVVIVIVTQCIFLERRESMLEGGGCCCCFGPLRLKYVVYSKRRMMSLPLFVRGIPYLCSKGRCVLEEAGDVVAFVCYGCTIFCARMGGCCWCFGLLLF